jgi:hypothetical protein
MLCMPVIQGMQEIWGKRIVFQDWPWQKHETLSEKVRQKVQVIECMPSKRSKALTSNLSIHTYTHTHTHTHLQGVSLQGGWKSIEYPSV